VSPILVRPVREQLEHDRIIRLLQAKNRRKFDAGINPGSQQNVAVGSGPSAVFPDLVLSSLERGRRLQAVVEVETGESVNHLEALAEWVHYSRLRAPFHLYVPSTMVDVARQLCDDNQIPVSEIWSFHGIGDDVRFTLVQRNRDLPAPARAAASAPAPRRQPADAPAKQPAKVAAKSVAKMKTASRGPAGGNGKAVKSAKAAPKKAQVKRGPAKKRK
jgi:hypothetical protein